MANDGGSTVLPRYLLVIRTAPEFVVYVHTVDSVLVVDEESAISDLLADIFVSAGYDVHAASTTDEAMSALGKRFSIAVCDSQIIHSEGHRLARWLAENQAGTKVILMCASGLPCKDCIAFTPCEVIAKPFLPDEIVGRVAESLRN